MRQLNAYFRLMRFHQPIGILLLWAPTAWALWSASRTSQAAELSLPVVLIFFLGTMCMRAAGCVINDIADRHFDKHVARTRLRPLTAGEIKLQEALGVLLVLLLIAAGLVLQLPPLCFRWALFALLIAGIYPFSKRYIQAPQLVLSLAFSMGIPMAYAALGVSPDMNMWLLFCINALWILMYDTLYAMMDRDDDHLIGVKSTAILFASYDRLIVGLLQGCVQGLWLVFAARFHLGFLFYIAWGLGLMLMVYQQILVSKRQTSSYFRAFAWSGAYGLIMWVGLF